jgi:hypothetical protein
MVVALQGACALSVLPLASLRHCDEQLADEIDGLHVSGMVWYGMVWYGMVRSSHSLARSMESGEGLCGGGTAGRGG